MFLDITQNDDSSNYIDNGMSDLDNSKMDKQMIFPTNFGGGSEKNKNLNLDLLAAQFFNINSHSVDSDGDSDDKNFINNNSNNYNHSHKNNNMSKLKIDSDNVKEWSVDQVVQWLEKENLKTLVDKFKENDISGQVLLELEQSDLEKMGFTSIGLCKTFILSLKKLKSSITTQRQRRIPSSSTSTDTTANSNSTHSSSSTNSATKTTTTTTTKICDFFLKKGFCKFGDSCKYSHGGEQQSNTTTTTTVEPRKPITRKFKEEKNKQLEKQKEKKENYVPFKSNSGIQTYLFKVKNLLTTDDEVITKMQSDINLWEDILSRMNLDNDIIDSILTIFTHSKITDSLLRENTNFFYSLLMKSNFLGHYSNLPAKILLLGPYLKGFQTIASLFKVICERFNDGVAHIPLEQFNSRFESSAFKDDPHIQYILRILIQRKTFLSQNIVPDVNSDQTSYKDFPLVPVLDELRSKKIDSRIRPLRLGTYSSADEYLNTHFHLLREDMIHPIRETLTDVESGKRNRYFYSQVRFKGFYKTSTSIGFTISFEYHGKIVWEKFSRLLTGSLVLFSYDGFKKSLFHGLVEGRPEKGTVKELQISLLDDNMVEDLDFLFVNTFTMIESSTFYQSYVNVLQSLQNIYDLPFQDYLLDCKVESVPPNYILRQPHVNFAHSFDQAEPKYLYNVLNDFPTKLDSMDDSQIRALKHCLTSKISIILGPPGTGKSHTGVKVVDLIHNHLHKSMEGTEAHSPIFLVCYTNHALDQFLNSILKVTKNVIRVGSRSRDPTLEKYNIRNHVKTKTNQHIAAIKERDASYDSLSYYINQLSKPINDFNELTKYASPKHLSFLDPSSFKEWTKSFSKSSSQDWNFVPPTPPPPTAAAPQQANTPAATFDSDDEEEEDEEEVSMKIFERTFDEYEKIQNIDVQVSFHILSLESNPFDEYEDVNDIPVDLRNLLFRYWSQEKILKYRERISMEMENYQKLSKRVQEHDDRNYRDAFRNANVVAATISGASRLKRIFNNINSKVVVIEEAAEVLEAQIVSVIPNTCEHLVLIGDHLQLKPSCSVYQLSEKYNLSVSLFERMSKYGGQYVTLSHQRRMLPNISQFIKPIYPNLENHESTLERFNQQGPKLKGFTSNVYFLSHQVPEDDKQDSVSKVNKHEAAFIVELASYIIKQGYLASDIIILTPYSGQLLKIKSIKNSHPEKVLKDVSVRTVDQFQGEERKIVLLSLVRSNANHSCGFVKISNRINVSISRARDAMFIIGNRELLSEANTIWENMFNILEQMNCIGTALPLICQNHPDTITPVSKASDFRLVPQGGCLKQCETRLDCGHVCPLACHNEKDHKSVICTKICNKPFVDCPHVCKKFCSQECGRCTEPVKRVLRCGHSIDLECKVDPHTYLCKEQCEKTLSCGHPCLEFCGKDCNFTKCKQEVIRTLPCGHSVTNPCFNKSVKCEAKCKDKLPCGHMCNVACNLHKDGKHPVCKKNCDRALVCGHKCVAKHDCSTLCPPCNKSCQNECPHSKCSEKCGSPCKPCLEPCTMGCEHTGKCSKLCSEKCDIKRCDKPCTKSIHCEIAKHGKKHKAKGKKKEKTVKHPCIGVCGEPCPKQCRTCTPDAYEPILLSKLCECEPTDRFIKLGCDHFFELSTLDTLMETENPNGAIGFKQCPNCKSTINSSKSHPRYKDLINQSWQDLEIVKAKLRQQIHEAEINSVVLAMGGAAGHWYRCSKNHLYYIGECGGAMERGKCIECQEIVGGSNHTLVSTSSHSNIDGSERPIYQAIGLDHNQII